MSNEFSGKQSSTPQWQPSPRLALWTELEQLHERLGMSAPTATLTIEQLEEEIARLKAQFDDKE